MSKNPLYDALADPGQLEKLYELDPKLFRSNLTEALESNPDVALLNFWKIRLEHGSGTNLRSGFFSITYTCLNVYPA
jgi:hypothetical protein